MICSGVFLKRKGGILYHRIDEKANRAAFINEED